MLKRFRELGVEPILFADTTPPEERLPIWQSRRVQEFLRVAKILDLASENKFDEANENCHGMRPPTIHMCLVAYLKEEKFKVCLF